MWCYIVAAIIGFLWLLATGHGQEIGDPAGVSPRTIPNVRGLTAPGSRKIVYVGAQWCGPCAGAKKFTIPELKKAGLTVEELDFDRDGDKLPAAVSDLPTWFVVDADGCVIDTIVGHVHQSVILKRLASRMALAAGPPGMSDRPGADARRLAENTLHPDLVAQLRRFLGTTKPRSHSSLAWSFEESLDIVLDAKTKLTRPKQLFAELEFRDETLIVTFAEPLPQAHVIKAGATISVDVPRVTIRGNVVTATADIAFGIQKDFEFTITKSPFDE